MRARCTRAATLAGATAALAAGLAGAGLAGASLAGASVAQAGTLPRPGLPVAGASMLAAPRREGPRVFWPGDGWLRLSGAAALPLGLTLDASDGRVLLATATDAAGTVQDESVGGAAFSVTQTASVAPTTILTLRGGIAAACSSSRASRHAARTIVRELSAAGQGRLQVDGANAVANTGGAVFTVADRCDGTQVSVRFGRVSVRGTRARAAVRIVRQGHSVFIAGPAPRTGDDLPLAGGGVPVPAPAAGAPAATTPTGGGSSTGTSAATAPPTRAAPVLSAQQQLAALAASVAALSLSGQPGQDLSDDVAAAQTAQTFGTPSATCTAMQPVGQAIFENVAAPTGAITASTALSLMSATASIDAVLGCSTPDANDLQAGNALLGAFGTLAGLGLGSDTAAGISTELDQAGEALIVGDETDGCTDLQFLSSALELLELAGPDAGGLSGDQGQALSSATAPIQAQLGCSGASNSQ